MRKATNYSLLLVLSAAVVTVYAVPRIYPARQSVVDPLEAIVPATLAGWTIKSMPIAATESLQFHVNRVLRYDEAVVRSYRRRELEVTIYAAHWLPGKASYSEVGAHTPDTCWVVDGWSREKREHSVNLTTGGRALVPAEIGIFQKDDKVQHVLFWHLVGGAPITFEQFGWDEGWIAMIKRGLSFVSDFSRFGFNQRGDQCFVRVNCNRPIREAMQDPNFQALLQQLTPLGIFASSAPAVSRSP